MAAVADMNRLNFLVRLFRGDFGVRMNLILGAEIAREMQLAARAAQLGEVPGESAGLRLACELCHRVNPFLWQKGNGTGGERPSLFRCTRWSGNVAPERSLFSGQGRTTFCRGASVCRVLEQSSCELPFPATERRGCVRYQIKMARVARWWRMSP